MAKKVIIVGGHGEVSMRLTKLLSSNHSVTSIIRNPAQKDDIQRLSATPLVLSLEHAPVADFSKAFKGYDVVYFSAASGGPGWDDRTKKVDYEGALKVFDALEGVEGTKPLLIMVSAVDVRDRKKIPAHYDQEDIAMSNQVWQSIGAYMQWKYEADKVLVKRTAFKWIILRPGALTNGRGVGNASIGRTHLWGKILSISRDDVAKALALLIDREDAAGLAIDMVGGTVPIKDGLDAFIKKGETDFLG